MTIDSRDEKPDLDAQIRAAEQRVIAVDRDWRRHNEALGVALRGKAGRAATFGGLGIVATLAGGLLLRWRLTARSRARDKLLTKALSAVRWPGTKARAAAEAAAAKPPIGLKSTALMSVLATVGTLLGAAARTGLKLPAKPGVSSLVMSVLVPMVTRWWRARASAPPVPAPVRAAAPVPVRVGAPVSVRAASPASVPVATPGPVPGARQF